MRNLYFQSRRFRDFNLTDCLDRIDTVSERGLNRDIRKAYDDCEPPDPCFVDTVALSLRMETAAKFLEHVHVSLEPRDFLLSKLFQFLYQPLTIQNQLDEPGALPLRRHLELWLDGLPETALARLYRFDWLQFFADSNRLSRPTLLGRLDRYLPTLRRQQPRAAWMGRRGPVPDIAAYTAIGKAVRRVGKGWTRQPGLRQVCQLLEARSAGDQLAVGGRVGLQAGPQHAQVPVRSPPRAVRARQIDPGRVERSRQGRVKLSSRARAH